VGRATLERLAGVVTEEEIPPDFLTYVAPDLALGAHDGLRHLGLQVAAAVLEVEAAQRRACLEIARVLDDSGIEHAFIKGVDFRYRLYPDPLRRASVDVDVMVPPEAAPGAVSALEAVGCSVPADRGPFLGGRTHTLDLRMGQVAVDLHVTMVQAERSRFESREVVARRERVAIGEGRLWVPCREDAVALALIHIGRHEGGAEYVGFKHGLDLLLACERWTDLDWEALAERAAAWRSRRLAGAGLWTWVPRLGSRVPDRARRALDPGLLQRFLATRTHRVLCERGTRARGARRASQLFRKLLYAEGWPERTWLLRELIRRGRERLS
jgi:hypothetical protein